MAAASAVAAWTVAMLALVGPALTAATADKPQCLFTGPHISFFGADPYHEQIPAASAATCCYLCAETPKCVAFEFNDHVGGGTCFLKDSTGVVPRVLEGAQSGVLIQPGTAISAEAVRANHAATTKIPAAAAVAAGAGTPAGAAATEAAGPWEASSAGTALGQSAGPNKVLQLGASLTAASGGTPGSRVDIGGASCLEGAIGTLPKPQRKSRK